MTNKISSPFDRDNAHRAADWLAGELIPRMTAAGFDAEISFNPNWQIKPIAHSTNRHGERSSYFDMNVSCGGRRFAWSFRVSDHLSNWSAVTFDVFAPEADDWLDWFHGYITNKFTLGV